MKDADIYLISSFNLALYEQKKRSWERESERERGERKGRPLCVIIAIISKLW